MWDGAWAGQKKKNGFGLSPRSLCLYAYLEAIKVSASLRCPITINFTSDSGVGKEMKLVQSELQEFSELWRKEPSRTTLA